jgi:hypothetical protein
MKNKLEREPTGLIGQIDNPNPVYICSIPSGNRTTGLSTKKVFF